MPSAIAPKVSPSGSEIAGILAPYANSGVPFFSVCGLAVAYGVVRRYWPNIIIQRSLAKCKEARSALEDLRLGQLSNERQLEIWDKLGDLKIKVYNLRDRHDDARNAGFLKFVRALRGLYMEARCLQREADKILMDFERLA